MFFISFSAFEDSLNHESELEEEMTIEFEEDQDSIDKTREVLNSNPISLTSEVSDDELDNTAAPDISNSVISNSTALSIEIEDDQDAPDISKSALNNSPSLTGGIDADQHRDTEPLFISSPAMNSLNAAPQVNNQQLTPGIILLISFSFEIYIFLTLVVSTMLLCKFPALILTRETAVQDHRLIAATTTDHPGLSVFALALKVHHPWLLQQLEVCFFCLK
jgi:hypothetical protein